jgi:glycosyltransferase involved in cell wall biosynthesis
VGITAVILSKLKRIPFVFEIRDLWPESAIDTGVLTNRLLIRLAYWFEGYVYQQAACINVLTPAFRRVLIEQKNIPPSKIIEIPNAADFALSETLLHDFDVRAFRQAQGFENRFVITYVGAHGVANQLEQVIEAAVRLQDTPVLFVLIGDGMRKPTLVAHAEELGLTNVRFLDPVPKKEVFRYILASDMGASVLKNVETFKTVYSNKTFDYFSCKKPVLMAIDGVSRELVEKAEAGYFVIPESSDDWEAKVRFCLEQPEFLARMGENGYRYARLHFDRTLLANRYLDALKSYANA